MSPFTSSAFTNSNAVGSYLTVAVTPETNFSAGRFSAFTERTTSSSLAAVSLSAESDNAGTPASAEGALAVVILIV